MRKNFQIALKLWKNGNLQLNVVIPWKKRNHTWWVKFNDHEYFTSNSSLLFELKKMKKSRSKGRRIVKLKRIAKLLQFSGRQIFAEKSWSTNFTHSPKWCQRDHRFHDRVFKFSSHLSVKFGQGKQIQQLQSILQSIKHNLRPEKWPRRVKNSPKYGNENKQIFYCLCSRAPNSEWKSEALRYQLIYLKPYLRFQAHCGDQS